MRQDVKKLIEDKDCVVCKHVGESIGGDRCLGCIQSGTKKEFELLHTCLTCKYTDKKLSEEPCDACDIRHSNDKWEVMDEGKH